MRTALILVLLAAFFAADMPGKCAFAQESEAREYPLAPYSIALPFPEDDQQGVLISLLQPYLLQAGEQGISLGHFPGRGGSYAWREITGKENKGSVLAFLALPAFFLQAETNNSAYAPGDITPLCILAYAPCALWVPEDSPVKRLGDLVALGRDNPQPQLIAGTGSNSDHQISTTILARAAGIPLRYLPYTGSETASGAVMDSTAIACWGYAFAQESMPGMRPLAVAGHKRSPALPDTPTFLELGMEVLYGQYIGIGMPRTEDMYTAEVIGNFFVNVTRRENILSRMTAAGYIPYPVPFADVYFTLPTMKAERETLETLSRLAAAGYIPHPAPFSDLRSALPRLRAELDALLQEYPLEQR